MDVSIIKAENKHLNDCIIPPSCFLLLRILILVPKGSI